MNLYGIFGAGGFGREIIPLAYAMLSAQQSAFELVFIESEPKQSHLNHYPVLSLEAFLAHPAKNKFFNIAIADHVTRKKIAERMQGSGAHAFTILAQNHMNLSANEIAEGAVFCGFTTVTANARIGKFFHANIYSYIAHDCQIGDYVTFAPSVHCNGNVIIEDEVYVGTGVIIKQGTPDKPIVIGRGAVIGMGAVVTKSVTAYDTVVGNPAKSFQPKPIASLG